MSQKIDEKFLQKLQGNLLSDEEQKFFRQWLSTAPQHQVEEVLEELSAYFQEVPDLPHSEADRLFSLIEFRIRAQVKGEPVRRTSVLSRMNSSSYLKMAAAVIFAILTWLIIQGDPDQSKNDVSGTLTFAPILPGGDRAVLVLSDGKEIILDSVGNGLLAVEKSVKINKVSSGQISYAKPAVHNLYLHAATYNLIKTPRGGQYKVVLSDGSEVWLNSQSSIRFSPVFAGNQRLVELDGEAYFQVAKDHSRPFKVKVKNSIIEVLGTHFNVMGYRDEPSMKTSLLEGSVKIAQGDQANFLRPGEQAVVNQTISVSTANVGESVEWKNGNFNFEHENLETIMRKISRWYDISVVYQGKVTDASFVGTIPRSQSINEVLNYLELTGVVHFKIKERRIIVMP